MRSSARGWVEIALRWALLAVTLSLSCLTGFATSYILLVLAVLATGYIFFGRIGWVFDTPARLFLAAFAGLGVLFAVSARQPADVLYAFNFVALLIYAPLATLFGRATAPGNAETVARLALVGTALGCAISLFEVVVLGTDRAGVFITDTIRLGDTAVLLGFLSLIGFIQRTDRGRWIYVLGPVLAVIVVLLTGARGAMLAFPLMSLATIILIIRHKWLAVAVGALAIMVLFAAALTNFFGNARLQSVFAVFSDMASGAAVADEAVRIRIELYKAGWAAFQQSPLIGHGWARLMTSIEPFLAETDKIHATLPHLHNEVLNFAVFGGIIGVGIYLALIAAPIVLSLRSPRDSQYRARQFGTVMLVLGYIVMGLPDTMLSFELHTALYVAFSAIILAYCRDQREARK